LGGSFISISQDNLKLLVVEDHSLTRKGIQLVLSQDPTISIVGMLNEGTHVIEMVEGSGCEVVLLDLELPDMNGASLLDELIGRLDATIVIITGTHQARTLDKALKAGVRCIVSKSDSSDHLLPAIGSAVEGERYLSPAIIDVVGTLTPNEVSLSPRQIEILKFMSEGETNKEIGYKLGIKAPTVSFHLAELRTKLNVDSNRKIPLKARDIGLI